jgi:transcriptional regulator with GAF, ATPase, and Fis domain
MASESSRPPPKPNLFRPGKSHICAFFHNQDEEYEVLLPFIKQGLVKGEKAYHIVDPKLRKEHLRRLETTGIDVKVATARRQLEVKVWDEAYLRNERFDQREMAAFIESALKEARSQGFRSTRLVAHMEWILEDRPSVEDYLEYEARLNYVLPKYRDSVICVYNCEKYDAGIVMDILRTHPVVMIGGVMQRNPFFITPDELLEELRERKAGPKSLETGIAAENRRLRRTILDLMALSGMSAMMVGGKPHAIAEEMIAILMSGLQLEAAHIRLKSTDGSWIETSRAENWPGFAEALGSAETREQRSEDVAQVRREELVIGSEILVALKIPVGIENEVGYVAVASRRPDFPNEMEKLVVSIAANQGLICLQNARLIHERDRIESKLEVFKEEIDRASMSDEIKGSSPPVKALLSKITKVAPSDSTVLITGETGTGKELVARAIHKLSKRAKQPFVSVNCAALPAGLISSELFGHEKGSFTGAQQRRHGRFELADEGTIFLDEVGELTPEVQVILLRVLQERVFERVGGNEPVSVDVRVLAATNQDLPAAIAAGTFRADLFYRLNVFPIGVPPLRDRKQDIPILVRYFVDRYATKMRRKTPRIESGTIEMLQAYHWPGNIRELENVIERSLILCAEDTFSVDVAWLVPDLPRTKPGPLLGKIIEYERDVIERALQESRGTVSGRSGAASRLGIPSTTLESRIKALKIDKHRFKSQSSFGAE